MAATNSKQPDPEAERIGLTVKALRERNGLRVGQLADLIGTAHSAVSMIETGARRPTHAQAVKIALALDVPLIVIRNPDVAGTITKAAS